jgi:hypothetical protein
VACAFCLSVRPLTKEHVFPSWLDAHLPGDRAVWILEHDRFGGERPFEVRRPSQGLDFTVRAVCADCNNGWMSALEGEAKPILERLLMSTELQPLWKTEQLLIARWATKTAMMMDFTQEQPLVPQRDRTLFFKRRTIPRRGWIWLGGCGELLPLTMSYTMRGELEPIAGGDRTIGFYTPFKIGHLVIFWILPGQPVRIALRRPWALATSQIWPKPRDTLFPPPSQLRDGEAFDVLSDRFWFELLVNDPALDRPAS